MMNKNVMIGAAVAGLVLGYLIYNSAGKIAGKVVDAAGEALNAVNPLNNENVISQGANSVYQKVSGSPNTPETDLYFYLNDGSWLDKGLNLFIPTKKDSIVQTVVRAPGEVGGYIGSSIYDTQKAVEDWLSGVWN